MNRTEIIQTLIDKNNYRSYLEIGVQAGLNFAAIKCPRKVGVDPDRTSKATIFETSDLFFSLNTEKFDCIFIDGLHEHEQVTKDILNASLCLNPGGAIICHDMNPSSEQMQRVPRKAKQWTGDCWKAWVMIRMHRKDFSMYVIDTDFGVGVIKKGKQDLIQVNVPLTYKSFDENKHAWLPLISVKTFRSMHTSA